MEGRSDSGNQLTAKTAAAHPSRGRNTARVGGWWVGGWMSYLAVGVWVVVGLHVSTERRNPLWQ